MNGIVSYIGRSIDAATSTFVTGQSASFAIAITPLVLSSVSIWVVVHGFAIVRGESRHGLPDLAWRLARVSLVLSAALSGGIYQDWIVSGAQGLADGLASVASPDGTDVYSALDSLEEDGASAALAHLSNAVQSLPMGGYLEFIVSLGIGLAIALLLLFVAGYVLVSKVLLALCLAVGPCFIACLAFRSTAPMFAGWLSRLLHSILTMMFLTLVVGILVQIMRGYLAAMTAADGSTNALADLIEICILCGVVILIVVQIPHLAASMARASASFGAEQAMVLRSAFSPRSLSRDHSGARSPPCSPDPGPAS